MLGSPPPAGGQQGRRAVGDSLPRVPSRPTPGIAGADAQALDAYRRASEADPASAAIHAEIATLNARANRTEDATRAARRALGHRQGQRRRALGARDILAAEVEGGTRPAGRHRHQADADDAITHLERARPKRPFDATLALTLAVSTSTPRMGQGARACSSR